MPARLAAPLPEPTRNARLFAGEVLLFPALPESRALVALALDRLRAAFPESDDPAQAQHALDEAVFLHRVAQLTAAWRKDPEAAAAFARLLTALGCDPETTYVDAFHLRCQPSRIGRAQRRTRPLHPHRDSWGSNQPAQVNWWLPVTPLAPGRTLLLFPDYWDRPIANDSAGWDWEALKTARRQARQAGRDPEAAYPNLPSPLTPPDLARAEPLLPEVGEVVAFSAAQLHASAVNATGLTRFSLETRTIAAADLAAGRGAPNLDGRAPRVPCEWFRRLSDRLGLDQAAVGPC